MKRILPFALAALLLLSSCVAPTGDTIYTTTVTTTTTAVTTTTPENTYRPDLKWIDGLFIDANSRPVNHIYATDIRGSDKIPCTIWVVWSGNDMDAVPLQTFEPIEYFTSLGWEILPQDAWDYVNPVGDSTTIFVSPTTEDFTKFDIDEFKALLEYYEIDPDLIYEGRIWMSFRQCSLKKMEA